MKIEIYGRPSCPSCSATLDLLYEAELEHEYYDISYPENYEKLVTLFQSIPHQVLPMIYVDGKFIGSYAQLRKLLKND